MTRQSSIYSIPGAGWPADPGLSLGADECYRVTSILQIINKPALVAWAGRQEALAYEETLRSVLNDGHADIGNYAWSEDDAEHVIEAVRERKGKVRAAEKAKAAAADIGTAAHAWIEWHTQCALKKQSPEWTPTEPPRDGQIGLICDAWLDWTKLHKWTPVVAEKRISCIGERWAGTLDIAGRIDGLPCVIDIKSSRGIYTEQKLQVAAYCVGAAAEAEDIFGEDPDLLPEGRIIRLPKTAEDHDRLLTEQGQPFEERILDSASVVEHYQAFLAAKALYEAMKRLKEMED